MNACWHADGRDPGKGERLVPQVRRGITKEGNVLRKGEALGARASVT